LEKIIDIYDKDIQPFAVELTQNLVDAFKKIVKSELDDKGESLMAASSCLTAI